MSRERVALSHISGALCDSGVVVPADELRYGEAIREIIGQRDKLQRDFDYQCKEFDEEDAKRLAEIAELTARVADRDESIAALRAVLTKSGAEDFAAHILAEKAAAITQLADIAKLAQALVDECPQWLFDGAICKALVAKLAELKGGA